MQFVRSIFKKFVSVDKVMPIGRWRIESCNKQLNRKIDLSNEDHCGPCGQYALEKMTITNNVNKNIVFEKSK